LYEEPQYEVPMYEEPAPCMCPQCVNPAPYSSYNCAPAMYDYDYDYSYYYSAAPMPTIYGSY